MSITFKYKFTKRPEPLNPIYTPSIPVTLAGRKESVDAIALLDSGADLSVIPNGLANILGLELSKETEEVYGIGGSLNSKTAIVQATIKNAHEKYSFKIPVKVIIDELDDEFPILIGRDGFFENFEITFKESARKITLKKVQKSKI